MNRQSAAPELYRRSYAPASCLTRLDAGASGRVEAIVSTFGVVDSYRTRMAPGCFRSSLDSRLPRMVWAHDWERPIGCTTEARELDPGDPLLPEAARPYGGLYCAGQLALKTRDGADAYEHLKAQTVDEWSIGFFIEEARMGTDGVEDLTRIRLVEWSPVLLGSNPITSTLAVRRFPTVAEMVSAGEREKIRALILGAYAEADAASYAIEELAWSLCCVVWSQLYETETPAAQRRAIIATALDEFSEITLRVIDALLPDPAAAEAAASEMRSRLEAVLRARPAGPDRAGIYARALARQRGLI